MAYAVERLRLTAGGAFETVTRRVREIAMRQEFRCLPVVVIAHEVTVGAVVPVLAQQQLGKLLRQKPPAFEARRRDRGPLKPCPLPSAARRNHARAARNRPCPGCAAQAARRAARRRPARRAQRNLPRRNFDRLSATPATRYASRAAVSCAARCWRRIASGSDSLSSSSHSSNRSASGNGNGGCARNASIEACVRSSSTSVPLPSARHSAWVAKREPSFGICTVQVMPSALMARNPGSSTTCTVP